MGTVECWPEHPREWEPSVTLGRQGGDCGVLARTSEGMGAFSNFRKVRWGLWSAGQNIRVNGSLQ